MTRILFAVLLNLQFNSLMPLQVSPYEKMLLDGPKIYQQLHKKEFWD